MQKLWWVLPLVTPLAASFEALASPTQSTRLGDEAFERASFEEANERWEAAERATELFRAATLRITLGQWKEAAQDVAILRRKHFRKEHIALWRTLALHVADHALTEANIQFSQRLLVDASRLATIASDLDTTLQVEARQGRLLLRAGDEINARHKYRLVRQLAENISVGDRGWTRETRDAICEAWFSLAEEKKKTCVATDKWLRISVELSSQRTADAWRKAMLFFADTFSEEIQKRVEAIDRANATFARVAAIASGIETDATGNAFATLGHESLSREWVVIALERRGTLVADLYRDLQRIKEPYQFATFPSCHSACDSFESDTRNRAHELYEACATMARRIRVMNDSVATCETWLSTFGRTSIYRAPLELAPQPSWIASSPEKPWPLTASRVLADVL